MTASVECEDRLHSFQLGYWWWWEPNVALVALQFLRERHHGRAFSSQVIASTVQAIGAEQIYYK